MYYRNSTQKDSVSEELKKPLNQRTPGVMAHITACSANGGVLLKPHFLPKNQTMAADYYCNMLESDVFPQIEGVLPEGERFWWQHDLASAHTALQTKQFLATKNITTLPWLPSGADLSPLDIYVNPELKRRLKEKDLSTRGKLMAEVSRDLGDMRADPEFLDGIRRFCRSAKNRAKWVRAHGGGISSSSLDW